jgi:hypothetical protein
MKYKDSNGNLDDEKFSKFLDLIIAFTFTYTICNPGVGALRNPIYAEMVNIIDDVEVTFKDYKFIRNDTKTRFNTFIFSNIKPITKSILTWWAFHNKEQKLLSLHTTFQIEHIYSIKRNDFEQKLEDKDNLEKLGNKAILERVINIRVSDYRFKDKIKYYTGQTNKKLPTMNNELLNIGNKYNDFNESDIINRNNKIIDAFLQFVADNNLFK